MIAKSLSILACLAVLGAAAAGAQEYPRKPITVDRAVRRRRPDRHGGALWCQSMGKTLGQTVIVENVGGAGGTIGAARVAKAASGRLHAPAHHIGHVDGAGALSQAALQRDRRTSSPSAWSPTCR